MPGKKKEKKAASKTQQRLFGMVSAYKSGKLDLDKLPQSLADKVKGIADGSRRKTGDKRKNTKGISKKTATQMASTKHKGLPETVKESKILRFIDLLNEAKGDPDYMDALKGGKADGMTTQDIADLHNLSVEYIESIISGATEIEMEHTSDPDVAIRIAMDHLVESPIYYDDKIGLPNMEEELEEADVDEVIDRQLKDAVAKFNDFIADGDEKDEDKEDEIEDKIDDVNDLLDDIDEDIKELSEGVIRFESFDTPLLESSNKVLSDFIDKPGDTEIWYEIKSNFDGWETRERMYKEEGSKYTSRFGEKIDPKNLELTHVLLGKIFESDPDKIFHIMNNWGGEDVNVFLKEKGVRHTSMSIGEIIKTGDKILFVDDMGFRDISEESPLTESIDIEQNFSDRKRISKGFTSATLNGDILTITHNGNMGNSIEKSVNPNLDMMRLPTIQELKDTYEVVEEKGSPDYAYYIKIKIK